MKLTITLKFLLLATLILSFFKSTAQSRSCIYPNGNYNPPQYITHCKSSSTASFNQDWLDRISALGGMSQAGIKSSTRKRSVFVNESINGKGGFSVLLQNGANYTPDAAEVGSTFAIDEDGDCIYEREDALLTKLQFNLFDEIILYNVSSILTQGDELLVSGQGSQTPFSNNLNVTQKAEWHLARFLNKAHNMGFEVAAVVPEGAALEYDKFYNFHIEYADKRSNIDEFFADISEAFLQRYIDLWINDPSNVTYKGYGEDTLFLPLDSDGRISDIDKYVVDLYNFAVFQHRINNGYIQSENSTEDDPCSFVLPENCNVGFDAHFAEIEWWDNTSGTTAQSDYLKLEGVMQASYNYRTSGLFDCYPSLYVAQGQVDLPDTWTNWTNMTPQQRADEIDLYADRIYIYAYQRVPCDCYWGQSNATTNDGDENDWFNKANYYSSNTISTEIYPVFNAKFYESTIYNSNEPMYYGDGNFGCNGNSSQCDYCYNRVGDALRTLPSNADPIKLGYVENVWQEQYDFDPATTSPSVPNSIGGYAWFKSTVLDGAGVINSTKSDINRINNKAYLYPNPSTGIFTIIASDNLERVEVYDLSGRLVLYKTQLSTRSIQIEQQGTYIVRLYTSDEVLIQKVLVTK